MIIFYSEFEKKSKLNISHREYNKMQHEKSFSLLKHGIYDMYGINITENDIACNEYGKPYFIDFPEVYFNISHTDGMSVCIISEVNCGIDIEEIICYHPKAAKRIFSETELAYTDSDAEKFCRIWTLKESYSKAVGTGLMSSIKKTEFIFDDNYTISFTDRKYCFRQFKLGNYIISACLESPDVSAVSEIKLRNFK